MKQQKIEDITLEGFTPEEKKELDSMIFRAVGDVMADAIQKEILKNQKEKETK